MPTDTIISADSPDEKQTEARRKIADAIRKQGGLAEYLRAQRTTRRPRVPPLPQQVRCEVDASETIDDVAEEAAAKILAIVVDDAAGERWNGEVCVCGPELKNGAGPKILARIPVDLEGEAPDVMTKARAETDTMSAQARTIDGLGAALVKIANAKASEAEAMAKIVSAVAEMHRHDRKWDYKIEKEKQQTEREEINERASTTRAKQRWDVFETLLEEYKDVATIWSQWFTTARKQGDGLVPGTPPTDDEMGKIFRDGRFEDPVTLVEDGKPVSYNIRGVVEEMRSEPDRKRRIELAKRLTAVLNALPKPTQANLKLTMISELGVDRALEIAVWLALPIVG